MKIKNTSRLMVNSLYKNGFEVRFDKTGDDRIFITQIDHELRLGKRILYQGISPINRARNDYRKLILRGWTVEKKQSNVSQ